jgi:hypothetical protein
MLETNFKIVPKLFFETVTNENAGYVFKHEHWVGDIVAHTSNGFKFGIISEFQEREANEVKKVFYEARFLPTEKRLAGLTYEEAENFITENVNKIFDEMAMMLVAK